MKVMKFMYLVYAVQYNLHLKKFQLKQTELERKTTKFARSLQLFREREREREIDIETERERETKKEKRDKGRQRYRETQIDT